MVSDVLTIGPCVLSVFLFLVFIYELVTSAQKYAKCLYNFSMVKINKILYSFFFIRPAFQTTCHNNRTSRTLCTGNFNSTPSEGDSLKFIKA